MPEALEYLEILMLIKDEDLEDEYGWHRTRAKEHRRAQRYGLYWWHQRHAEQICHEIGRRARQPETEWDQLALDVPGRVAPELRP